MKCSNNTKHRLWVERSMNMMHWRYICQSCSFRHAVEYKTEADGWKAYTQMRLSAP